MKKPLITLSLVFLCILCGFGQKNYYATDTSKVVGVKLIPGMPGDNSIFIKVEQGDSTRTFYPSELTEYGFEDGTKYVTHTITLDGKQKPVFLESLIEQENTLYYLRYNGESTFYLEKDSGVLIKISKRDTLGINYKNQLALLTSDCPDVAEESRMVGYGKRSMEKFIGSYNQCELKYIPHLKYGVTFGFDYTALKPVPNEIYPAIELYDFETERSITAGIFIDVPLLVSQFSLRTELQYLEHGFSYNHRDVTRDLDFVANIRQVRLPVMIRYILPTEKVRPFFNAGTGILHHVQNTCQAYETRIYEEYYEVQPMTDCDFINKNYFGYNVGGGIEFDLKLIKHIFLEARKSQYWPLEEPTVINFNEFQILMGISF